MKQLAFIFAGSFINLQDCFVEEIPYEVDQDDNDDVLFSKEKLYLLKMEKKKSLVCDCKLVFSSCNACYLIGAISQMGFIIKKY